MLDLQAIHAESRGNQKAVTQSDYCGCFACKETFPGSEVTEFVDENSKPERTAVCPRCGIDAVLPGSESHTITPELLSAMCQEWCSR